jgi:hypothetical protein
MKQPKDDRSLSGFGRDEKVDCNAFDDHQKSNHSKDGSDFSILVIRKNADTRGFSRTPTINTDTKEVRPDQLFIHQCPEGLLDNLQVEDYIGHVASFRSAIVRRFPRLESRKICVESAASKTDALPSTEMSLRARVTAV